MHLAIRVTIEDETLVIRELDRLREDKEGKEPDVQSVHRKRELEYLQGLRDQVKQTSPIYLPNPIHVIIIDYATPQVLVAFDRILASWMKPIAHDDENTSHHAAMRNFGLFNAALYDVVRAIFEPLEYRYGGGNKTAYVPHKEQLDCGGILRLSYLSSAICACINEMYPAASNDHVVLREGHLQSATDHQEGKMPSNDPLECVIWATDNKVEYDGPPCMNIISLTYGPISSLKDHFAVSATKIRRVRYKFTSTPLARFLCEHYARGAVFVDGMPINLPEAFSVWNPHAAQFGAVLRDAPLELYQRALETPLPPGFGGDTKGDPVAQRSALYKQSLVMHDNELFRGGLRTSDQQSPTITIERKSKAKKKYRLAWLSNAATYRRFQSAQVRRRRT